MAVKKIIEDGGGRKYVQDTEVTIPVKKVRRHGTTSNPAAFFVNRFWGRRSNGVAINEADRIYFRI